MRRSQSAHVSMRRLRKSKGILLAGLIWHKSRGNKPAEVQAIGHRVYCRSIIGAMHTLANIP